jgi:hypothetical protein
MCQYLAPVSWRDGGLVTEIRRAEALPHMLVQTLQG